MQVTSRQIANTEQLKPLSVWGFLACVTRHSILLESAYRHTLQNVIFMFRAVISFPSFAKSIFDQNYQKVDQKQGPHVACTNV